MAQNPTGITLGALLQDPSLLDQQAKILKQKQLAELLLSQGAQHPQAANPNPWGALLQNLAPGVSSAAGIYLANKAIDAEQQQQRNSLEAQLARSKALFGIGSPEQSTPVLDRPLVVSPEMEIPSEAWHPAGQGDQQRQLLASALLGVTPQEQQSHLAAQGNGEAPALAKMSRAMGLSPEQGFQWYMQDSNSFLDAAGKAIQPTETQKDYAWQGIAPQEVAGFTRAERTKAGTQSYSPDTTVVPPGGKPYVTANPGGGYRILYDENGNPVKVPLQGEMEFARGKAYAASSGSSLGSAEQEYAVVPDENGVPRYRRKTSIEGAPAGQSPQQKAAEAGQVEGAKIAASQEAQNLSSLEKDWMERGNIGTGMRAQTARMRELLDKEGYRPGAFNNAIGTIGSYLSAAGFSGDNTFVKTAIQNSQFTQLSGQLLKDSQGGRLGGQGYTDTDRAFDQQLLPQVTDTPQGARKLLEWMETRAVTDQARANQYQQAKLKGIKPDQFAVMWQQHGMPKWVPEKGRWIVPNVVTGGADWM